MRTMCNLWSQSYYFTTCLVVIISLKDEISDVFIADLYLCLLFLPLLLIIINRGTVLKANILKNGNCKSAYVILTMAFCLSVCLDRT